LKSKEEILAQIIDEVEIFNSMKDFLNKFNNIHFIPQLSDESKIVAPNVEMAIGIVTTFIDSKSKKMVENLISGSTKSTIEVASQVNFLNNT